MERPIRQKFRFQTIHSFCRSTQSYRVFGVMETVQRETGSLGVENMVIGRNFTGFAPNIPNVARVFVVEGNAIWSDDAWHGRASYSLFLYK